VNTEYLKTFLTLAENGSFSKTAKDHVVVQSTVSSRIRELEKEVGQKLFIRNHNYAELTLAGKALLEYAEQIVALEASAFERINLVSTFTDRLVVGSVYAFYDCYMCDNLERFMLNHNDISVRMIFGHSSRIISGVSQGSIDVGYSHHAYNHPGFNCELICEDEIALIAGGHNKQFADGVPIDAIKDLPLYNSNFLYTTTQNWLFPKHKLFQLDVDIGAKIIPFLLKSEYYTFLPRKLIANELASGAVTEIPVTGGAIPPVQNFIIYRHEHPKSNTIKMWMDEFGIA
jgi:LysR family transcriptional repressor of citA